MKLYTPLFGSTHFLAAHLRQAQGSARHSIVVSAGDLIGASPLISALFHDEPTIEAMNLIGLEIHAVGNHEFDEGPAELLRMQRGGGILSTAISTATALRCAVRVPRRQRGGGD
jgi:5'-nucleotidase